MEKEINEMELKEKSLQNVRMLALEPEDNLEEKQKLS